MAHKKVAWIGTEERPWQEEYRSEIESEVPKVSIVEFDYADQALAGLMEQPYNLIVVNAWLASGLNNHQGSDAKYGSNRRRFSLDLVERIRKTSGANQRTPMVVISHSDFGSIPDQNGLSTGRSLIPEYNAAGVELLVNIFEIRPQQFYRLVEKYLR